MQETIKQNDVEVQNEQNNAKEVKPYGWRGVFFFGDSVTCAVGDLYKVWVHLSARNIIFDSRGLSLKKRNRYIKTLLEKNKEFRTIIAAEISCESGFTAAESERFEREAIMFSCLHYFDEQKMYYYVVRKLQPLENNAKSNNELKQARIAATAKEIISYYTKYLLTEILHKEIYEAGVLEENYKKAWQRSEVIRKIMKRREMKRRDMEILTMEKFKNIFQVPNTTEAVKSYEWGIRSIMNDKVDFIIKLDDEETITLYLETRNLITESLHNGWTEGFRLRTASMNYEEAYSIDKIKDKISYRKIPGTKGMRYRSKKEIKNHIMQNRKNCKDFYKCMYYKLIMYGYEKNKASEIAEKFSHLYFFDAAGEYHYDYRHGHSTAIFATGEVDTEWIDASKERLALTAKEILTWYINDLCEWLINYELNMLDIEYRKAWERAEEWYVHEAFRLYRRDKSEKENLCLEAFPDIHITEEEIAYLRKCIEEYHDEKNQHEKLEDREKLKKSRFEMISEMKKLSEQNSVEVTNEL